MTQKPDLSIPQGKPRLSVGIILMPRFTLGAMANFVDVLRLSADEGDRSRQILCKWAILSDTMTGIPSSSGITVQPTHRLNDPGNFDYIAVVGGLINEISNISREYRNFLQLAAKQKVPLVGICTGVFVLHQLGLMEGYKGCVSWYHHGDFVEQFDGLKPVSDRIFVVDRDRLTCSAGVSAAHMAAWLVEKHVGAAYARKSLRMMTFDRVEKPEKIQPAVPLEITTDVQTVRRALHIMEQNLDTSLTIEEIAGRVRIGRRHLERQFKMEFALSPSTMFRTLRLDQAELLLKTTKKSIAEIAAETGFTDSSHFIRVFRSRRKTTPSAFRRLDAA